jgi:hypothetical protein
MLQVGATGLEEEEEEEEEESRNIFWTYDLRVLTRNNRLMVYFHCC